MEDGQEGGEEKRKGGGVLKAGQCTGFLGEEEGRERRKVWPG